MQYILILKNEKLKSYSSISLLLVIFNMLGFVFLLFSNGEKIMANLLLLISIAITAAYSFIAINNKRKNIDTPVQWHRIIFLFCSLVWILESYWWLSIVLVFFVLFDMLAHRKLEVKISETRTLLPSLIKKEVGWNELNNLVLKDDLLTIDFKNNKLFQHLILTSEVETDELKFNQFCHQCIQKSR